jgi:hypothetical protein
MCYVHVVQDVQSPKTLEGSLFRALNAKEAKMPAWRKPV